MLVPSQYTSHAYDINELGQATGAMTVGNAYHAFRYTPRAGIEDLGALPNFPFAFGKAINIGGQVAGTVTSASGNATRVFRYTDGIGMVELGGVGESNDVWGMNARGDFVGRGQPTAGLERAFLYTDEGGLQDLTSLIDPALGLRMFYAHDINDAGQIVGLAYESAVGRWLGVRLTPTAEPTGIGGGPTDVPGLRVHGIAPNPSNGFARLEYELSQPRGVRVSIYDVTGRLVRTLVDAPQAAGVHPAVWDGRDRNGSDVPSGAYFVRIQAGAFRHTEKLVLVR
jgi:probable HAF family extracellular repeat protein